MRFAAILTAAGVVLGAAAPAVAGDVTDEEIANIMAELAEIQ